MYTPARITVAPPPRDGLPPGPRATPIAQTISWLTRPLPFLEHCHERFGDVFVVRLRHEQPLVVLCDPEQIKQVFTGDAAVLRAGEANSSLEVVLGSRSVLLLDGPEHMSRRKLMLPPFHGERMQRYAELMVEVTRAEVARWRDREPLTLRPRMQAITLEVIMRAVFGITEAGRREQMRALLQNMIEWTADRRRFAVVAILGPARLSRLPAFRRAMAPVDELLVQEAARRRAAPDLEQREDILSMLLQARFEDGSAMSDAELRDQLLTLLLAGHETTATTLAWVFERLVRNPHALERLCEDVRGGDEESYLDAVIHETLRLRPVVPVVVRRLAEPLELAGYRIPAGVSLAPCIYLVQRRGEVYEQPERFLPERFLEHPPGTYTWIPFGGGVRRCLGAAFAQLEMKKVLATVLREVDLEATTTRPERVVRRGPTLTPQPGGRVLIRRPAAPASDIEGARSAQSNGRVEGESVPPQLASA